MPKTMDGFHYDSLDLLVQRDGDGGDTMNRHGIKRCGQYWRGNGGDIEYQLACVRLEPYRDSINSWVRHPGQPKWNKPTGPDGVTRDQFISNEIAMGYSGADTWSFGQKDRYKRLMRAKLRRFSRYQSGDLSAPHHWGINIRALGVWYLYPFLLFSDLFLMGEIVLICFFKGREPGPLRRWLGQYHYIFVREYPKEGDGLYGPDSVDPDLNQFLMLRQAQDRFPTPVSWFASVLYVLFRPKNHGLHKDQAAHPILQAWLWYFRWETGASDFGGYFRPIINKFVEDFSWKRSLMTLVMGQRLVLTQVILPLLSCGRVRAVTR